MIVTYNFSAGMINEYEAGETCGQLRMKKSPGCDKTFLLLKMQSTLWECVQRHLYGMWH